MVPAIANIANDPSIISGNPKAYKMAIPENLPIKDIVGSTQSLVGYLL